MAAVFAEARFTIGNGNVQGLAGMSEVLIFGVLT
jgi:hypothetical protein